MASRTPYIYVPAERLTPGGTLTGVDLRAVTELLVESRGMALLPSDTCYSIAARPAGLSLSRKIDLMLHRTEESISLAFDGIPMAAEWAILTPPTL